MKGDTSKIKSDITFIAEIGMNHNGNFGLLFELIKQASISNADIAKFQLGWRAGPGEINNILEDDILHILKCCEYHDIKPMFSVITNEALDMLQKFDFEHFKVASRTVRDNPDLVSRILKLNKRTFLSLGMWDDNKKPFPNYDNIEYLWCKSEYPTYPWDLDSFPKDFALQGFHGYSDHTVGIEVALSSIMRGASVIEKHFTLDKSDTTIRDHALSATPDEFALLVQLGRNMRKNYINSL